MNKNKKWKNVTEVDPLGTTVETTLRQVLGWRPRPGDVDSFRSALDQAFTKKVDENGQERWIWQEPTTVIRVEGGAVTGAQASIFALIQSAVDQTQPLLTGLEALIPDSDPEDVEASRAIIRNSLNELVSEMGTMGGPRQQRIDEQFELLLGKKSVGKYKFDPEKLSGQLGQLQQRLGLYRRHVNTIEEEHNLTNFLILANYVMTMKKNWDEQRDYFKRDNPDAYLGTQLVYLNRYLGVIAEQVQEVEEILDSVSIGEAERQLIDLPDIKPSLTINELLSWVENFVTVEGPYLIQDGGKDGVIAMTQTLEELQEITEKVAKDTDELTDNLDDDDKLRVKQAFNELAEHLENAVKLAKVIHRDNGEYPGPGGKLHPYKELSEKIHDLEAQIKRLASEIRHRSTGEGDK